MFQNDRYMTCGIKHDINEKNPVTFLLLWNLIDEMEVDENKKDYLQIFVLRAKFDKKNLQEIVHMQEKPPYKKVHRYFTEIPIDAKVYAIDDGEHSTMLLAEEY
ncbi:DUF960 family protein [Clostridium ljungdahlii]|uniref:DUF960 domain-containing protein n=1 Tax=Clostridium ljungdahlii TaxID=1538 RepID=A0A162L2R7_9CLOT|nr:DUF960 family protein [Clostridium ljungdahlii]OAA83568.1 hypothetical protein WY13_03355 [Clostridium ljungdahlii]